MPNESLSPTEKSIARRVVDVVGWISLLATLALCAPGIVATANAEAAVPEVVGPGCGNAEQSGEDAVVSLYRMMERLKADAAQNPDPSNEVVALDNHGFSYPVTPIHDTPAPQR
jgi:hypothetical protein